jgi:16S rRNA (cytosine967-C5)-methyltransferase
MSGLMQLKPGGRLVYATCSLEPEENEEVVRQTLRQFPTMKVEKEQWRLPGREPGDGFYAAVITSSE